MGKRLDGKGLNEEVKLELYFNNQYNNLIYQGSPSRIIVLSKTLRHKKKVKERNAALAKTEGKESFSSK